MRKACGKGQSGWSNIQGNKINLEVGEKENWCDGIDNIFVPTIFGIYSVFCLYAYKHTSPNLGLNVSDSTYYIKFFSILTKTFWEKVSKLQAQVA